MTFTKSGKAHKGMPHANQGVDFFFFFFLLISLISRGTYLLQRPVGRGHYMKREVGLN